MKLNRVFAAAAAALVSTPAFAHHPGGGMMPTTMTEGLLSGVGHPIIGLDHLAFVVAVGIAAVLIGRRFVAPLFFIIATLVGTGLHLASVNLPFAEVVIALSVALIGFVVLSGRALPLAALAALFSVAGLFHGFAYGEAVFGAESTPVVAYLTGLGITQYLVALVSGFVVVDMIGKGAATSSNMSARLTGAMVAGAGCFVVGTMIVDALFAV